MTAIAHIEKQLGSCLIDSLGLPVLAIGKVKIFDEASQVLKLSLGCVFKSVEQEIKDVVIDTLKADFEKISVELEQKIIAHKAQNDMPAMRNVKNLVVVASGKGGVGKSTTTVNLALAMAHEGARVGILDADIYGPSIPHMLGIEDGTRPNIRDEKYFEPIERYGVQALSMGMLVTESTPMVWRGPKASGALQQLMSQTLWNQLDYLFIDMPPGTGDIQLTLAQRFPLAASVIVTTPQTIALLDAKKGVEMFRKIGVEPLGIIENMSTHVCSQCGHEEAIFGYGGGERIAEQYQTALLGSIPLTGFIGDDVEHGKPSVVAQPESTIAKRYGHIALQISAKISLKAPAKAAPLRVTSK